MKLAEKWQFLWSLSKCGRIYAPSPGFLLMVTKKYISKYICDGDSSLWHQKYLLPCTNVLGFIVCKVTSKVIGIGNSECSWIIANKIILVKRSDTRSNVSVKKINLYKSSCIESAIFGRTNYEWNLNNYSPSHVWNYDDDVFDYQLEKWGVYKDFSDKPESVKG